MARTKSRRKIYLAIVLIAVVIAFLIPFVIQICSDYMKNGSTGYYPNDRQRQELMEQKGKK